MLSNCDLKVKRTRRQSWAFLYVASSQVHSQSLTNDDGGNKISIWNYKTFHIARLHKLVSSNTLGFCCSMFVDPIRPMRPLEACDAVLVHLNATEISSASTQNKLRR